MGDKKRLRIGCGKGALKVSDSYVKSERPAKTKPFLLFIQMQLSEGVGKIHFGTEHGFGFFFVFLGFVSCCCVLTYEAALCVLCTVEVEMHREQWHSRTKIKSLQFSNQHNKMSKLKML